MTIENRLQRLEKRLMPEEEAPRFWIDDGSGFIRSRDEVLTRATFEKRYPDMRRFTLTIDRQVIG